VHLVIDPKQITDQPRAFIQILSPERASLEATKTNKWQDAQQVQDYLNAYLLRPGTALILRRWAYEGLQTSEFIVRPAPEILSANGQAVSLALVCRLNRQTRVLDIVRPAAINGDPDSTFEERFQGHISFPSAYGASACDSDGLDFLDHLPEAGADIDKSLRDWSRYLDWRQKLAEEKANQLYPYSEWSKGKRPGTFAFYLKEPDVREKLKIRFVGESLRAAQTEDPRERAFFQGEFSSIETPGVPDPTRGRGHYHSREKSDPVAKQEQLVVTLSLSRESDSDSTFAATRIPSSGFLRLAMEGELAAVDIQQNGLQRLAEHRGLNSNLREWLFDIRRARPCESGASSGWTPDQELNAKQHACVSKALAFEDLLLLWGPPGTGKTTVISEIGSQFCRRGERVLVSSQANLAVDQALEKLPRLPHIRPARVSTSKKKDGLGIDARTWIKRWLESVSNAAEQAAEQESDPIWRSFQQDWSKQVGAVKERDFSPEFERQYLRRANVIGATCLETGKPEFRSGVRFDARFDLAIVDEVSKATPPELLLPSLMGRRTLLVGDHRQLPPVFKDSTFPEALENGDLKKQDFDRFRLMVTTSLFEGYFRQADPSIRCALDEQYRMHPHIMDAVNLFYADSPLRAGGGESQRARARAHSIRFHHTNGRPWLQPGKHLVWIDTSRDERGPVQDERVGTSRRNETEVRVCRHLMADLVNHGLTVGLISFYRAQIQAISKHLWETKDRRLLEFVDAGGVNTVDQFQGSERDVIIVSLARTDSQLTGEFVNDFRRINVAMSRAKCLLIVLGSGRTFDSGSIGVPKADCSGEEAIPAYGLIRKMAARVGVHLSAAEILGPPPSHSQRGHPSHPKPFNPSWRNSRQSR
jgi:hypothetical protein